jgi:hypothetical protein
MSLFSSQIHRSKVVEAAGINFPLFIGFGVDESLIAEYGTKYNKKAWFLRLIIMGGFVSLFSRMPHQFGR